MRGENAQYRPATDPLNLSTKQLTVLQVDNEGNLKSKEMEAPQAEDNNNGRLKTHELAVVNSGYSGNTAIFDQSAATVNLINSTAGLISGNFYNSSATDYYVQFHDTATTPAGGATPELTIPLPAGQVLDKKDFGKETPHFANGIAFAVSTTHQTYTAGTATAVDASIRYVTNN